MINISPISRRYAPALYMVLSLWVVGCVGSQRDVTIQESLRGGVYLERISTRQFQAAHPIRLAPALIAKSLQGVQIQDAKGLLQSLSAQQTRTIPIFSQEDIALLAPAIADALSQAAPDQQVSFRIVQAGTIDGRDRTGAGVGSGTDSPQRNQDSTTAGRLFVYGRSLYLTIHQFRYHTEPPDNINMPNRRLPEPTGLRNRTVLFTPESALRPDIYAPPFAAEDGLTTLVIDYDALAKTPTIALPTPPTVSEPTPAVAPAVAPPLHEDIQQIKNQMKQKESEVEELRKELQEIKRQLGNEPTKGSQTPSRKP
ncbi:MAG: hypothetical protein LZF62_440094 [Nitrospira sp.]|nr:MAG: hypothetical protein LZF62_440094 [Nitrospira sp.]